MGLSKLCNVIVLFLFLFLGNSCTSFAKGFRVHNKGVSFDKQWSEIMTEINSIPEEETITIRIDYGYYAIDNAIEIKNCKQKIRIIGSRCKQTIISGSIEVVDWEVLSNGFWRARVPAAVDGMYLPDQLFVNGVRATRSRIPNEGSFILKEGLKNDVLFGAKISKADVDLIPYVEDYEIPFLTIFRKWTSSKRYLSSMSREDSTLYFSGIEFPSYIKLEKGNGLIVENTKAGIDVPGEWCVDRNGYIYYYPKEGEVLENIEFRIPIVDKLLVIQNADNVCVKNIIFEHTSTQIPKEGVEFVQAASSMSAAIEIDNAGDITFENCEVRNTSNYGIWFNKHCNSSLVIKSYFHDLGAGGIKIGTLLDVDSQDLTKDIIVENNIVKNYGQLQEGAVGVLVLKASDCKICYNDVHYGNYSGISLGWVWGFADSPTKNNEVSYNNISNIGSGYLNDLGGIYTVGKSEGTHIHHNVISNVTSGDFRGWGIYADEGTTGVLFEKNLTYLCTSGGFHQHYGSENVVRNNIFAWGDNSQFTFTSSKGDNPLTFLHNIVIMQKGTLFSGGAIDSEKFVVGNNCYWSVSDELPKVGNIDVHKWIRTRDTTSVFQDPQFRDPQNADFRFQKKTICNVIGFEPFDYSKAGVYGRKKWKKLAESCKQ